MRKLASVQKILNIEKHPNADSLEIASILGWKVVTKLGEFKVGDEVVYCEVDSILPKRPEFSFLEKVNYRIKAIKLRGIISMGICFPKSILGLDIMGNYHEGDDVTDLLEILKYEPPISENLMGKIEGPFPHLIPKTDEDRCQGIPSLFELYKKVSGYMTEKLDGSSVTYYYTHENDHFGICSRNLEFKNDASNSDNLIYKQAIKENINEKLKKYSVDHSTDLAVQGELIGEKVQKNRYKIKGNEYFLFSIYNITERKYLGFMDFIKIIDKLDLKIVPVLINPSTKFYSIEELSEFVRGLHSEINTELAVEGIVWRSLLEMYNYETTTHRASFKVLNPDWMLSEK